MCNVNTTQYVIYRYNQKRQRGTKRWPTHGLLLPEGAKQSLLQWVSLLKNNRKTNWKEHDIILHERGRAFLLTANEELVYLYLSFYSMYLSQEKACFLFFKALEHQHTSVLARPQWHTVIYNKRTLSSSVGACLMDGEENISSLSLKALFSLYTQFFLQLVSTPSSFQSLASATWNATTCWGEETKYMPFVSGDDTTQVNREVTQLPDTCPMFFRQFTADSHPHPNSCSV